MKVKVILLLSCAALAACATYREDRVPAAISQMKVESQACVDNVKTEIFHTARQFAECLGASREHFAMAIEFRHSDIVDAYKARVLQVADRLDRGLINANQAVYGWQDADRDFYIGIVETAQIEEQERQRTSAALAAMGQALQSAAAYERQNRPAPPTVTTTTCTAWSSTSGQCVSVTN